MGPARSQRFQFERSTNEKPPAGVPGGSAVGSAPVFRGFRGGSGGFRAVPRGSARGSAGSPRLRNLASKLGNLVGIEACRGGSPFPERVLENGFRPSEQPLFKIKKGESGLCKA